MREYCERCGDPLTEWWTEGELVVYCSTCEDEGRDLVTEGILDHDELYDYAGYAAG